MDIFYMKKCLLVLLFLLGVSMGVSAQEQEPELFEYDSEDPTVITGLTEAGMAATELEIPATVTSVASNAFADAKTGQEPLTTITIKGNPTFEAGAFGSQKSNHHITEINMGSSMTVANMVNVLNSLGTRCYLQTIDIDGWSGNWENITSHAVLTSDVGVRMPAEIVKDQVFGAAKVYGRFSVRDDRTLATFCGNATFYDGYDEGSNMLFYVPVSYTKGTENQLHIKRVFYIVAGQGVLVHPDDGTSHVAYLPRIDGINAYEALPSNDIANNDKETYSNNMFVGVKEDIIGLSETEGEYTNFVLYEDAFWPVGDYVNLRANRAYLQIPTANLTTSGGAESMLRVNFDDGTTDITTVPDADDTTSNTNVWYTLDGRRLEGEPTIKGIYINQNRKIVIK